MHADVIQPKKAKKGYMEGDDGRDVERPEIIGKRGEHLTAAVSFDRWTYH
jgi:hypothetical protein